MPTSKIPMQPVESRQLAALGYDPASQTMAIMFKQKNGRSRPYHYPNVTPEQFEAQRTAESLGHHFNTTFKGNAEHPHEKIIETDEERAARKQAEAETQAA